MSIVRFAEVAAYLTVAVPVSLWDLRERRVPDLLVAAGFVIAVAAAVLLRSSPVDVAAGAAVGFLVFAALRFASRGRLGFGDVKYSAFLGALCGVEGWLIAVFAASVTGLAVAAVLLIIDRRYAHVRIPFAPFLSFGGLFALFAATFGWASLLGGGLP